LVGTLFAFFDVTTDIHCLRLGQRLAPRMDSPNSSLDLRSELNGVVARLSVDSQGLPRRTPNKTAAISLFLSFSLLLLGCVPSSLSMWGISFIIIGSDRYRRAGGELDDRVAIGSPECCALHVLNRHVAVHVRWVDNIPSSLLISSFFLGLMCEIP
jgi:hypothetical protein